MNSSDDSAPTVTWITLAVGDRITSARSGSLVNSRAVLLAIAAAFALLAIFLLNSRDPLPRRGALAAAGAGLAVWGIRYCFQNPSWLIFALVAEEVLPYLNIIPLDPGHRWFLRYPLLLPLTVPAVWKMFRSRKLWQGPYKLMMLFWGWALFSIAYSLNPAISLGRLLPDFLLFGAVVAVADEIKGKKDVQRVLGHFVLACGLVTILDAMAYFFLPQVLGGSHDTLRATWTIDPLGDNVPRFAGVFNNPNAVGGIMTATVLSGVAHWRAIRNRRAKLLLALSMVASVYFAIMADSRSETAAAIVGCTAYGIWKYRWRGVGVLAVAVVLTMAVLPFVNLQYLNRDLATATGRTEAWAFELQMIKAKPVLGYGYQVEGEIFQSRYWTNWQDFWSHGANTSLHNGYISLAIGLGIPGLLLWFIPFFAPWWAILRSKRDPWSIKPLFFLAAVPILLLSLDESVAEPRGTLGLFVWVAWAIAAYYQMWLTRMSIHQEKSMPEVEALSRVM